MTALPSDRSEVGFDEFKPPYDDRTAAIEANRCLYCHDAPCITACPTGIDIPTFIRKISTGNVKGAARTILDSNILGHSCARVCPVEVLCVGDCVYNALGAPPIQIGKLQRYATDRAAAAGWTFFTAGPDSGKRVAVVGGGPAGLAAAHRLRRFGHRVTLFEKRPRLGGLNSSGVAPYKVKSDVVLAEVERVLAIGGVEVRTGVEVPRDVSWQELLAYDALFLGVGLGPDTRLPGADLRGVVGAVEWIEQMKTGRVDVDGVRRVVVLGGGNTAIDVVREWLGLGVPEVTLAYRGTEAQMSGYAHEWSAAKDEGARVAWAVTPIGFEGRDGAGKG
ncbi:MAG: FAD-dependent oxidoreductase, partial [Myxococcota bacterium]